MSINKSLRQRVAKQARYRCGYCQLLELISGIPLTLEHIIPKAKNGSDDEENLWLSCRLCNESKGTLTESIDPDSRNLVTLFNPRTQHWGDHFSWSENGLYVVGQTAIGRATVVALELNQSFRVCSRAIWVEVGKHPPED